jgi:2-dehydropantoate 2-reductase
MRVAVVGAGALGSLFAGRLRSAGNDVVLVGRSAGHIDAIRARGLTMRFEDSVDMVELNATTSCAVEAPVELVLFLTKAQDSGAAADKIRPLCQPDTILLSLQNGLGHLDEIIAALPGQPLLAGVTAAGAMVEAPGTIRLTPGVADGSAASQLGPWRGASLAAAETVAAWLSAAGLPAQALGDIRPTLWTKLAMACAMNAVGAISRLKVGTVLSSPAGRELIACVIGEVVAVARAHGVDLDLETVNANCFAVYDHSRTHIPSMAKDVLAHRPTEVASLNMAVVRAAEEVFANAPINRSLGLLVGVIEQSYGEGLMDEAR